MKQEQKEKGPMKKSEARGKALADFIDNFQHMPKAEKLFAPKESKVVKIEHELSAGDESAESMPEVGGEVEFSAASGKPAGDAKSLIMKAIKKIMMNDAAGNGKGEA